MKLPWFPLIMRQPDLILSHKLAVRYKTFVLNADGSLCREKPWKRNLILDTGLDRVAAAEFARVFTNCAVGTGTDNTRRDSGAITFTQATTVLSASSGFFESADVGRLFKFNSGLEVYITAFTSSTIVSVSVSQTVAVGVAGTIWYVNQTGLQTETARTSNVSTDGGDNDTTFSVDTYTHQRTFLFPAVVAGVTYHEIGWSDDSSAGANLFGRDKISGSGDALLTGQQYKVIVQLLVTISPVTPTAAPDVGNNGFDTEGDINHQYIASAYARVQSNGGVQTAPGQLDAKSEPNFSLKTSTFTLQSSVSYTDSNLGDSVKSSTNASYTNGNRYRDASATWAVGDANGSIYGCIFGPDGSGSAIKNALAVKFDSAQTKDSSHTLTLTLRRSWDRILTN